MLPSVPLLLLIAATALNVMSAQSYMDSYQDLRLPMADQGPWKSVGSTIFSKTQAILTTQRGNPGEIQRGGLWNLTPFPYTKSWEIVFNFKVSGRAPEGGEGMALWLTENPNELGPVMGSRDRFKGLAVIFDSKDNDKLRNNPSISAHYFDGTQTYGHDDDGLKTQIAGCIADFRNRKNIVSNKIAYNGTHLSVFVDLTGTGEYRKCITEKLVMREGAPVYLGVSAETTDAQIQETHDVLGIEVKGVQDWSQPAPPKFNAAQGYQQQYAPPQAAASGQPSYQAPGQTSYQSPGQAAGQASYQTPGQATGQAYQAPAQTFSGDKWAADSESSAVHDKLDQLLKASSQLESGAMGSALKELEANVMRHVSGATKALFNRLSNLEKLSSSMSGMTGQVDGLMKMIESSKGSVDSGRIDAEKRSNELSAKLSQLSTELADMKVQLDKSSRTTISMIDRRIRDSQYNMSQSMKSSGGMSMWVYIAFFQCLFVAFLVYRHMANKKLDKLL